MSSTDKAVYIEQGKIVGASGGGGSSTLEGLTDVTITTPSDGQALVYDTSTESWINGEAVSNPTVITYSDFIQLTPTEQETGNWLVTGWPGTDLNAEIESIKSNFGTVESSSTATYAHSIGEYFLNSDAHLVVATDAISIGDTIAIGTNVSLATLSEVISGLNSTKADKVSSATNGNFAALDSNGNLIDSGSKASDFITGTVEVANGGTGQTSLTSGEALIGDGTNGIQTRAITNNTDITSAIVADTSLITSNTLKNAINRTTSVAAADTDYSASMARAISMGTTDYTAGTTVMTNGSIYMVYE